MGVKSMEKTIIYVKSESEIEDYRKRLRGKKIYFIILTKEVLEQKLRDIKKKKLEKKEKKLYLTKWRKLDLDSGKKSLLKLKLFGTFQVSDEELEKFVIEYLKAKNEGRKEEMMKKRFRNIAYLWEESFS
jgi:hypothetical protein